MSNNTFTVVICGYLWFMFDMIPPHAELLMVVLTTIFD